MPRISTKDLNEAVDAKYEPFIIEVDDQDLILTPVLRLPREKREELSAFQKQSEAAQEGDSEIDPEQFYSDFLSHIANDKDLLAKFLAEVDGDLATLQYVVSEYSKVNQVGEASPSAS